MKKFNVAIIGWFATMLFMSLGSVAFAHFTNLQGKSGLEMGPYEFEKSSLSDVFVSRSSEGITHLDLDDIPGYLDADPFGLDKKNPSQCNHDSEGCSHDHGHDASWGLEFAAEAPAMMTQNETLPAGTWIIAMDESLQDGSNNRVREAYGLAIHLLHGDVPLKWIIDPNKTNRTDVDFSASARLRFPSTSGYSTRNFRTGPIAIFPGYEAQAQSIINSFGNGIRVYELQNATTVPVHSDLTHKPFVFVEQEENPDIHTGILSNAGLVENTHYEEGNLTTITETSCVTIITVPHNDDISSSQRNAVKDFTRSGGNFLAQCAGVRGFQENTPRVFTNAGFVDE
ncbi:MAG TPA: hypothetical protein VJ917_09975, partial [Saprospiraceae bacterium]|nr:hypothetical protein [Saprospiraceae bacterium]